MNASTSSASRIKPRQSTVTVLLLALSALAAPWLAAWLLPAFAQPQSFHDYADQRTWFGLPHAANLLSNLPFLIIGGIGLHHAIKGWRLKDGEAFADQAGAWPYALLFLGVLLTAFGSAWYHAQPNDATLLWDRLPMAIGFAGLAAGTLGDRAPLRLPWLMAFAFAAGGTVLYWKVTANLLPYLVMQAGFIAAALIATVHIASRYTHATRIYVATGLYALALIFERLDHQVHALLGGWISGHTLKHLAACAAILIVYAMLRRRRRIQ